jgi:hypothetical protein
MTKMANLFLAGMPGYQQNPGTASSSNAPNSTPQTQSYQGAPMNFWIGAGITVLALKYVSEHEGSKFEPAHINIGGYNALAIVTVWMVGFGLVKLVMNKFLPNAGGTAFVNYL